MSNLYEHLAKIAAKMPEHIALVSGKNKIEYGRFIEAVNRLANGLNALGIKKGDHVAVMLPNVPHFCISYYAILELGAVVIPINFISKTQEIAAILNDSGASALISWYGFHPQFAPALTQAPHCKECLILGELLPKNSKSLTQIIAQSSPYSGEMSVIPEDLAAINYGTSTPDRPLGAVFTHASLLANALTSHEMFRISAEERVLAILPLFHPLGQTLVMNTAFFVGATLILMPRFSPEEVIDVIRNQNVTFLVGVPGMYKALLKTFTEEKPTPSLKYCLSYGGQMPPELLHEFEHKFDTLILEAYGFTEAGPLVTSNRINRDRKIGSVGLPLVSVDVKILDEQGALVRPNQSGEIWIKSPSLTLGYYNQPDESKKCMRDGWFFSGDIGYLDDEHYLFVQERKEDIIVKSGFQIFPYEVEKILLQHPNVAEAAVIGVADTAQGHEVKAFVIVKEGLDINPVELIAFCKEFLPVYKSPKYIEICKTLPKSPTGRILKQVLRVENKPAGSVNEK